MACRQAEMQREAIQATAAGAGLEEMPKAALQSARALTSARKEAALRLEAAQLASPSAALAATAAAAARPGLLLAAAALIQAALPSAALEAGAASAEPADMPTALRILTAWSAFSRTGRSATDWQTTLLEASALELPSQSEETADPVEAAVMPELELAEAALLQGSGKEAAAAMQMTLEGAEMPYQKSLPKQMPRAAAAAAVVAAVAVEAAEAASAAWQ